VKGRFLFLGTGSSMGIPVVTCKCAVCLSQDRCNHRLRPSGLIKIDGKQILMDAGPDFREQALAHGIDQLDGVILTHGHYDHIAGLDDLRVYYFLKKKLLPCLLSRPTFHEIKIRNPYFFDGSADEAMGGARFDYKVIDEENCEHIFCNLPWTIVSYMQNGMQVTGYRLGNFAYVMDLKEYTPKIFSSLKGVEVLVMSGLRETPSHAHLTLDEAIEFSRKVGAKETWFSHISHDLDHEKTNRRLPEGVELAYDGLEVSFQC
jgi:phosphoribosyl 1,2-cyclic phosphate phosphodiesterase